jgi:hypothetical protein
VRAGACRPKSRSSSRLKILMPPGYGDMYGIPPENLPFDWVAQGQLRPGAPFITREAPGVDVNEGGGNEVVINPGDFMQEGC